jgi:hypothetical protein
MLVLHLVAICSRKMRREHFQDQLVGGLAPDGERDQGAIGIVLIAILVSEHFKRLVIEPR